MYRKNNSLALQILLLSLAFCTFSCTDKKPTFTLSKEVVEIPLHYNDDHYYSVITINSDTINAIIDTGFSRSTFAYAEGEDIGKEKIHDVRRIMRILPIIRVNQINWGGLKIENLGVSTTPDISPSDYLGGDILKKFCVKFDNQNKKILLSNNADLIEKKGIKIPFKLAPNNSVWIDLKLGNKVGRFLLDTGFPGEFLVDSTFYNNSRLASSKSVKWYGKFLGSVFLIDSLHQNEIVSKTMSDCTLGEKVFKNVMISYNMSIDIKHNCIGTSFLRRFSSFTIDYLNKYLYLELPEDTKVVNKENSNIQEDVFLTFSDKEIKEYPIEYLDNLYMYYNSFDFMVKNLYPPFLVSRTVIEANNTNQVAVGDTLIGVDNAIFSKEAFEKLRDKSNYRVEINKDNQIKQLVVALFMTKESDFHFLKNGEILTVKAKRRQFLDPPPFVGYGFQIVKRDFLYYGSMNFYVDYKAKKMSFHFSWQTLSGRKIEMEGFDDEKDDIPLSNIH